MIDGPFERPFLAAGDARADEEQPLGLQSWVRRVESGKCELPPSMRMSPGSSSGTSSSMTSSTGGPALTMIMILRGRFSAATSSCGEWVPTIFFPLARPSTNASTLRRRAVEDGDGEPVALHVQDEVFAHHGQADQADVGGLRALAPCSRSSLIRGLAGVLTIDGPIVPPPRTTIRRIQSRSDRCACRRQSRFHGGRSGSSLTNRASWASMYSPA